ncbi:MAG: HAMP domain-containing sensor histidine kinase [Bacteroidales bacterium]|jgi:signal transduction histidine kinase|nr:HAMP domain-containing sensor histidine kinase [Bacteroidales bacterium]HOI32851.1 HAMP domain-containing sensor histidine kinase [Bacteroidales bacterium]
MSNRPEFTEAITDYIISKIPPYIGLAILQLDEDGRLINWMGPMQKYLNKKPVKNIEIEALAPFLTGMIPPLINPMVLPHVQIRTEHYAEIHIVEDELMHLWVFFVDQTRNAEQLQQLLQELNNERLNQHTTFSPLEPNPFSAFHLLDFASFIYLNKAYKPIGNQPVWIKELRQANLLNDSPVPMTEIFPFIEVFQYEAASCWDGKSDSKIESGIWEEETITGRKIYLKAIALQHRNNNYLLIKSVNREGKQDNQLIQKAREQKLTLDQLARTERELKKLLDFKDQFVSIVSHDLRSPIGAVIGIANLLLQDKDLLQKLNLKQKELLLDINDEMQRLLDYNDKLYHWSNLELGNFKLHLKTIELSEIGIYVERMQHLKLKQKRIKLVQRFETEGKTEIIADETLLGQAMNNLVGNAIKFTPKGGTITIGSKIKDNCYQIFVSDTGIGMPDSVSSKLFEGFTRKSRIGTFGEKGTGLGLGIVKKILEAHNFDIHVESETGKGSTFIISIAMNL